MSLDAINGLFEAGGGIFLLNNCRIVLRDKAVKGISILSTAYFAAWGAFNIFYYPSLHQWFSFCGGILIVVSNLIWIFLLLKYRNANANNPTV